MLDPLAAIARLCANVNSLEFKSPGIFTNAATTNHDVTVLFRDAVPPETQLYTIENSQGLTSLMVQNKSPGGALHLVGPRRIDNSTSFTEQPSTYSVVSVPEFVDSPDPDSASVWLSPKRGPLPKSNLSSSFTSSDLEFPDVPAMFATILDAVNQYAEDVTNDGMGSQIESLRREHAELTQTVQALENTIASQKQRLDLSRVASLPGLDGLVEREEAEIRALEAELRLLS